jgi:cytochrome c
MQIFPIALRGAIATLPLVVSIAAYGEGDAARGKAVYESLCSGCHTLDENRYGPAHRGVFGRKAGSAPDYSYSEALYSSQVIWSQESLERWLVDPGKFIPGVKMAFSVPDATDRRDVIEYLKEQSARKAQ